MIDQDLAVSEALAAADRVRRYRRLRNWVAVLGVLFAVGIGINTFRITNLNQGLCDRTEETRNAVRELALATLITTPIPAEVDPATRAQILRTREDRKAAVEGFLARYPSVDC